MSCSLESPMTTSMRMSLNRSSTRKYYIRHQEQHLIGCGNFTVDLLCGTELRRKKFKKGKVLHSISGWKFQARISKANPWQDFKFMHMAKPVTTNFDNHRQHISGTLFPAFFFFFFLTLWLLSLAPQNALLGEITFKNY